MDDGLHRGQEVLSAASEAPVQNTVAHCFLFSPFYGVARLDLRLMVLVLYPNIPMK